MTEKDPIVPNMVVYTNADLFAKIRENKSPFVRNAMLALWPALSRLPLGKWFINLVLGVVFPFMGTSGCKLTEFSRGRVSTTIANSWRVRDFNGSVDVSLFTSMCRITSALALASVLDFDLSPFLNEMTIKLLLSPDGDVVATCLPGPNPKNGIYENVVSIIDSTGAIVAQAKCVWGIRPARLRKK